MSLNYAYIELHSLLTSLKPFPSVRQLYLHLLVGYQWPHPWSRGLSENKSTKNQTINKIVKSVNPNVWLTWTGSALFWCFGTFVKTVAVEEPALAVETVSVGIGAVLLTTWGPVRHFPALGHISSAFLVTPNETGVRSYPQYQSGVRQSLKKQTLLAIITRILGSLWLQIVVPLCGGPTRVANVVVNRNAPIRVWAAHLSIHQ